LNIAQQKTINAAETRLMGTATKKKKSAKDLRLEKIIEQSRKKPRPNPYEPTSEERQSAAKQPRYLTRGKRPRDFETSEEEAERKSKRAKPQKTSSESSDEEGLGLHEPGTISEESDPESEPETEPEELPIIPSMSSTFQTSFYKNRRCCQLFLFLMS
jgi:hypothetical protein